MAKMHELIFKIKGAVDGKMSTQFKSASSNIDKMAQSLNKLDQTKLNINKYKELTNSINSTKSALDKAKTSVDPLNKAFEDSKRTTANLKNEWNQAKQKVEELSKAIYTTTNPTREMRSELALAKLEAKRLGEEFKDSERNTKTLGNEFKSASQHSTNLENSLEAQRRELESVGKALDAAGISTNDFERDQKSLDKQIGLTEMNLKNLKRTQESYQKVQEKWGNVKSSAGNLVKNTAMVTAALAIPTKIAIDDEDTMADVNKMVDFATAEEMAKFEREMRKKIGTTLPLSFTEYGNLIANAAGAGIDDSELQDFGVDAAKMAVAFDVEGGEAGETMAKWRSAFAMNQAEVVALADKINYLGDNSAAKASEISSIVSKVGALGGVAGMSSGMVAAIGTAMVGMGVDSDVGATAIKKMATSLTKGAGATKDAQAYFKKMGMTSEEVAIGMQEDSEATIFKVLQGIKSLDAVDQTSALREIFGEVSLDAVAPLLQNIDELQKYFGLVDETTGQYVGSMEKEFQTRSATTSNSLKILKNNMSSITSVAGSTLLPLLVELSQKGSELAQRAQEWMAANPEKVNMIMRLAAVFGALVIAASGLKLIVSIFSLLGSSGELAFNIIRTFGGLAFTALTVAGKAVMAVITKGLIPVITKLFTLFMASPIGLQIGIIIAAIALLYTNWDKITKFFKTTLDNISKWFSGVVDTVKGFADVIGGVWDKVKNFFTGTTDGVNTTANSINNLQQASPRGGGTVSAYASGGIVTRPELAVVGEGGDHEAIIPLNNSKNAAGLWNYAGQRLGLLGSKPSLQSVSSGGSSGLPDINLSIDVNVNGSGDANTVREAVLQAMAEATPQMKRALKALLEEMNYDSRRVVLT